MHWFSYHTTLKRGISTKMTGYLTTRHFEKAVYLSGMLKCGLSTVLASCLLLDSYINHFYSKWFTRKCDIGRTVHQVKNRNYMYFCINCNLTAFHSHVSWGHGLMGLCWGGPSLWVKPGVREACSARLALCSGLRICPWLVYLGGHCWAYKWFSFNSSFLLHLEEHRPLLSPT